MREIQKYEQFYSSSHQITFTILEQHQCFKKQFCPSIGLRASRFSKVFLAGGHRHDSYPLREDLIYLVLGNGGQHHAFVAHLKKILIRVKGTAL